MRLVIANSALRASLAKIPLAVVGYEMIIANEMRAFFLKSITPMLRHFETCPVDAGFRSRKNQEHLKRHKSNISYHVSKR